MLTADDASYVMGAHRALSLKALDASKPEERQRYVSLYQREALRDLDPVATLRRVIRYSEFGSAMLFSGYRGTGKSTELLRLKRLLEEQDGAVVVYCNMHDFYNMDAPPDIPDVLLATTGAFAHELGQDPTLKEAAPGYWAKMVDFLKSIEGVGVEEVEIKGEPGGVGLGVKLALQSSPTFQKRLQEKLASQVGALAREVRAWYRGVIEKLRQIHGEVPIVVMFDSMEHIQGTGQSAPVVAQHLVSTFNRADHLRIPNVHVIYTVPPWLKIKAPGVLTGYDHTLVMPCLKVRDHDERAPYAPGIEALVAVVAKRFDYTRLLSREQLEQVILATGGYFRDLFRVLQRLLLACDIHGTLPATQSLVDRALDDVRNDYLPLAIDDARWLAEIDQSGDAHLPDHDNLGELARFFDSHLVLTYRNGTEWYRAHPLIAEEARRIAAQTARSDRHEGEPDAP